ncbi:MULTISPECIES: hypothetical protein [Streptomyces]|jgi:hypothetical protein|uniref:Chaplin n=1 Tax=Streptomyces spinosisporus TaxID=2927582 RepID=A0ABS9X941_9ACTN|nr:MULTISPECIES: hypothetical protein [Streptomyces]EPD67527.1 hypothetical protein HMPREF1211_01786 [Streptomyces sp. HGB0020]MCI3238578.1 hypothetical protein [Streptomyces spinosisporus]
MKKIGALAALTMVGLTLATPAHADEGDHGRINIGGRTLSPNALCKEALTLVPVAAPWTAQSVDDACNDRDHSEIHHGHIGRDEAPR